LRRGRVVRWIASRLSRSRRLRSIWRPIAQLPTHPRTSFLEFFGGSQGTSPQALVGKGDLKCLVGSVDSVASAERVLTKQPTLPTTATQHGCSVSGRSKRPSPTCTCCPSYGLIEKPSAAYATGFSPTTACLSGAPQQSTALPLRLAKQLSFGDKLS
jgi:hypothetical protein